MNRPIRADAPGFEKNRPNSLAVKATTNTTTHTNPHHGGLRYLRSGADRRVVMEDRVEREMSDTKESVLPTQPQNSGPPSAPGRRNEPEPGDGPVGIRLCGGLSGYKLV